MFEYMTYETILNRMLEVIPSNMDKREGSLIYDALAPVAVEQAKMYISLDAILQETFGDTASRDYLIRRALERGLSPYPASFAVWEGEFNISVPIGARFSIDDLNFIVTDAINDTSFMLECETIGSVGNRKFGTMIPIDYISGLTTATLKTLLIPAQDEEDTEDFRERYLNSFSSQSFGGNIADYLNKTNSIAGVGATKVTPVWQGGGTVKLTILDAEYNKASDILIENVQEFIDPTKDGFGVGFAPIGHIVTVDTAQEIPVTISTNITFDLGYSFEDYKNIITQAIEEYFIELRTQWADYSSLVLRIAQIETIIMSIKGIVDINNTKLNNISDNLVLNSNEIITLIEVINDG